MFEKEGKVFIKEPCEHLALKYADEIVGIENRKTREWFVVFYAYINGYNKAKEDVRHDLMMKLKEEAKNANEWHYVKDELPPIKKKYCGRSELVLVLSKEKEMQYAQYVEKEKTWARGICEINFKPYAWKEIVLPRPPEES